MRMRLQVWERYDARSAAVLVSSCGGLLLPLLAVASPELFHAGAVSILISVWVCAVILFVFTLRVGRLTDLQFRVVGIAAMVGLAISAFIVTDPAVAPAFVALLSAMPAIAAMSSPRRTTIGVTVAALLLATGFSVFWSTSLVARLVAVGASLLTVSIPVALVATLRSSLEFAMRKVERLGEIDPLTHALNRRGLTRRHARVFENCVHRGLQVGFLLIDVDHFKSVNDSRGHAAGDRVLVNSVAIISAAAPSNSLVSRIGGEEFVVMFATENKVDASAAAERIRSAVAEGGEVTVSIGVVVASIVTETAGAPNASTIIDELTRQADLGTYVAKSLGRDRVVLRPSPTISWTPGLQDETIGTTISPAIDNPSRSRAGQQFEPRRQAAEEVVGSRRCALTLDSLRNRYLASPLRALTVYALRSYGDREPGETPGRPSPL